MTASEMSIGSPGAALGSIWRPVDARGLLSKLPAPAVTETDWSGPTVAAAAPPERRWLGTAIAVGVGVALLLGGVIYGVVLSR